MSKLKKARIALVGTGWWATSCHLPALGSHPDAQIVAICDLDAAKLRKTAEVFNIETSYTDLETMLASEALDGVMVATHHAAHYPVAKACLERGLHVFIEKPMTLLAAHARSLVNLAEARNLEIVMGYNLNHSDLVTRARDIVRSGVLGAAQYINGIFSQPIYALLAGDVSAFEAEVHSPGDVYSDPQRSGGGHGHLQITHLAGMLFFITGLRIKRVQSLMAKQGLAVDVVNAITAEFEDGALGNLGGTGSLAGGGRSCQMTITCEKGWIELDENQGRLVVRRAGQEPEEYLSEAKANAGYPYFAPTHNFVDLILGRADNVCGGVIGWLATELLDAAYRSADQDGVSVYRCELYAEQKTC